MIVALAVCFVVEALVTGFTSLPLAGLAFSAHRFSLFFV